MEINFDQPGDGDCNDYDASLLGYENSQYFIQPKSNGYIAICHARDDLAPQGSLEVSAWLEADIENIYGFALLFGWRGEKRDTTDACMFGIRRKGSITEAFYSIRQAGRRKASAPNLRSLALDNARHTLRVVLFPDGQAFGYLDEQLFATYQFEHCSSGPVGMMAWGPGDQKIYFDDLKLFALP